MVHVGLLTTVLCGWLASVTATLHKRDQPSITSPAKHQVIQPGEEFDFNYNSIADYGTSSYAITVYLVTKPPTAFAESLNFFDGYYFGRYEIENYPAIPYSSDPPPQNLSMPDFSKSQGGFGAGSKASNASLYLAVFEEYADGQGVLGRRVALSYTEILYNGTVHGA